MLCPLWNVFATTTVGSSSVTCGSFFSFPHCLSFFAASLPLQASSLVSVLCGELQSEQAQTPHDRFRSPSVHPRTGQAVLRQEREAAARRRELFRSQDGATMGHT